MEYVSSDTSVWVDFMAIRCLDYPFRLPYRYIMSEDAIIDELLTPQGFQEQLLALGLEPVNISLKEFELAQQYRKRYIKLSAYDSIALAIAKQRSIVLMTGDKQLRAAANSEGVVLIGTLGILDELAAKHCISRAEYTESLKALEKLNGGIVRLPKAEIRTRLQAVYVEETTPI